MGKAQPPTVVLLAALILLAALVLAVAMPRETENTPVAAATISPTFDEAAYQSRLEAEAYAEVEHETADIPSTYDLPEPPQEADSEPCGKGGFECQDKEDWERLAIVIYQEAGGDDVCDMCRYRVADVVLNRVNDPRYPDTIEGVLMDNKYGLQWGLLSVTGIVWPDKASEPAKPPPCSERGTLRPTFSKGITATSMAIIFGAPSTSRVPK